MLQQNSYIEVPCFDPCCPKTGTATVPGKCVSCQTGCRTNFLETVLFTTGCDATSGGVASRTLTSTSKGSSTSLVVGSGNGSDGSGKGGSTLPTSKTIGTLRSSSRTARTSSVDGGGVRTSSPSVSLVSSLRTERGWVGI